LTKKYFKTFKRNLYFLSLHIPEELDDKDFKTIRSDSGENVLRINESR